MSPGTPKYFDPLKPAYTAMRLLNTIFFIQIEENRNKMIFNDSKFGVIKE